MPCDRGTIVDCGSSSVAAIPATQSSGDRGIHVLAPDLAAVERPDLDSGLGGAWPTLVPDRLPARTPLREEVGMGEVESPYVDDPHEHALAVAMPTTGGRHGAPVRGAGLGAADLGCGSRSDCPGSM